MNDVRDSQQFQEYRKLQSNFRPLWKNLSYFRLKTQLWNVNTALEMMTAKHEFDKPVILQGSARMKPPMLFVLPEYIAVATNVYKCYSDRL